MLISALQWCKLMPLMTVGCINSGCMHDADQWDAMIVVVEGMTPPWLASGISASERRWRVCLAPGIRHTTQMPSCHGIGGGGGRNWAQDCKGEK